MLGLLPPGLEGVNPAPPLSPLGVEPPPLDPLFPAIIFFSLKVIASHM